MSIANNRTSGSYFDHLHRPLLSLVKHPPRRVLEIGCGTGATLSYFKNLGASFVVGVELVPEVAEIASKRQEIDLVLTGSVESLDLEFDSGFDLIVVSHVLEHLIDPWKALRRLRELLLPGGQLIGTLPNVRNVRVVLPLILTGKWKYEDFGIMDWTHLRFFSRSSLIDLLQSTGFNVDTIFPEFYSKARVANMITLGLFRNIWAFAYSFSSTATTDPQHQDSRGIAEKERTRVTFSEVSTLSK